MRRLTSFQLLLSLQVVNNATINAHRLANATGEVTDPALSLSTVGTNLSLVATAVTGGAGNMYDSVSATNPALEWKIKTGSITIKLADVAYWTFTSPSATRRISWSGMLEANLQVAEFIVTNSTAGCKNTRKEKKSGLAFANPEIFRSIAKITAL